MQDYPSDGVDGVVCKILCKPDSVCEAQKCCGDNNKKSKRKSADPPASPTHPSASPMVGNLIQILFFFHPS